MEQGAISELMSRIDALERRLEQAQTRNFQRWPILSTYVWPNRVVTGSYTGEVQALREWLQARIAWLDQEWRVERVLPGVGTGLRANFYNNPNLQDPPGPVGLLNPNLEWPDAPAQGLPADGWSVRFSGEVEAPTSGNYEIEIESNDRTRVWIAGEQVVDAWGETPAPAQVFSTGVVRLVGGQRYDIVIEHADLAGPSLLRLRWKLPGRTGFDPVSFLRQYPAANATIAKSSSGHGRVASER